MIVKTTIGIHFAKDCFRIVQVSQRSGKIVVDKAVTGPFDGQAFQEPEQRSALGLEIKQTIEQAGFDQKAAVIADMPNANVFYSTVETDLTREEDIRRLLKFELEDDVPVPFDDLVVDLSGYCRIQDKTHCFVAAAHRSEVQSLREVLSEAGMMCTAVCTDVNAMAQHAQAVVTDHAAIIVHVEDGRLIIGVVNQDGLLGGRSLAYEGNLEDLTERLITELELTVRVYSTFLKAAESQVLLSVSEEMAHVLTEAIQERFDLRVQKLDIQAAFQRSGDVELNPNYSVALGMAVMHLSSGGTGPNFIATDLSEASLKKDVWRAGRVCACLVVLLIVLLGVRTFFRIHTLEEKHTNLKQEIETVFSESLPEVTRIVQPLPQMVEQLDRVRKEHELLAKAVNKRALPLGVMQIISEKFTAERDLLVSSMTLNHETVKVVGTGGSFESVEALAADLRNTSEFKDVKLEDVTTNKANSLVQFRLLISRAL